MRMALVIAAAAGIIAAALIAMVASAVPTKDYDLSVDALLDKQSLFVNARVVLANTGRLPLTNVLVDYGEKQEPVIAVIKPGEKISLSPPEGVQLEAVTVTAEPGIKVIQKYREPIKLPGMIGS